MNRKNLISKKALIIGLFGLILLLPTFSKIIGSLIPAPQLFGNIILSYSQELSVQRNKEYTSFDQRKIRYYRMSKEEKENLFLNIKAKLPKNIERKFDLWGKLIIDESIKYNLDPLWMVSLVWCESHFQNISLSHKGARGLMQLMPKTAVYLLKKYDVNKSLLLGFFHPQKNVKLGIYYFAKLLNRFKDYKIATVAYNMGPTWVSRRLKNSQPVGVKNKYLTKINSNYVFMTKYLAKNSEDIPDLLSSLFVNYYRIYNKKIAFLFNEELITFFPKHQNFVLRDSIFQKSLSQVIKESLKLAAK